MDKEIAAMIESEKEEIKKNEELGDVSFGRQEKQVPVPDAYSDLVEQGVNAAVIHKIKNDDKVKEELLKTADTVIGTKIEKKKNIAEKEENQAIFENNKDACDLYGIDEKTVPKWVVKIAGKVQNFWYAIWLIVGFFTTAPIVFLSKKIAVVFKRMWLAVTLAVVIYLAIIFVPVVIKFL